MVNPRGKQYIIRRTCKSNYTTCQQSCQDHSVMTIKHLILVRSLFEVWSITLGQILHNVFKVMGHEVAKGIQYLIIQVNILGGGGGGKRGHLLLLLAP